MHIPKINIAIVDDHTLFRNGLAGLLNEFAELNLLFEAKNGVNLQEIIARHPQLPDVILMDINMPEMDGYRTTSWLKATYPSIKVIALSMYDEDKAVMAMLKSGACGYILKDARPSELLEAIQTVHEKDIYLNEMVSGKLIHEALKNTPINFSNREMEFLKLCCSELTYKEIADMLFVSVRTVDNYRDSLFQKLGLKSRTGLVLYCIQQGIVKL